LPAGRVLNIAGDVFILNYFQVFIYFTQSSLAVIFDSLRFIVFDNFRLLLVSGHLIGRLIQRIQLNGIPAVYLNVIYPVFTNV
jgi:hypothetical protein